jgi:hypothetical protein
MRDLHRARTAIAATRRSSMAAGDRLPTVGAPRRVVPPAPEPAADELAALVDAKGVVDPRTAVVLADAALAAVETHDDATALDALMRRLAEVGTIPSLLHLLRARRHAADGDLPAAMHELDLAAGATDPLTSQLRPRIHATHGRLQVLQDPATLDKGIAACRTGRELGLRWWRRTTAADTSPGQVAALAGAANRDSTVAAGRRRGRGRATRPPAVPSLAPSRRGRTASAARRARCA